MLRLLGNSCVCGDVRCRLAIQPPKFYKRYSLVKVWLIDIKLITSHNYSGNWLFGSIKHACLPAKKDFSGRKIHKTK